MKNLVTLSFLSLLLFTSCKDNTSKEPISESNSVESISTDQEITKYPPSLSEVFKAHGGMQQWNDMNALSYEMTKGEAIEKHLVSLKDRRVRLDHPNWAIGFDGNEVWLKQNTEDAYKGNARFYHNLYFYFYAMPFVLGDEGITYEVLESTKLLEKEYHGVKVSYGEGVGDSPKDEYILYFDSETHQMEWLGYTVTYRSNEKSDSWSFIHYADWAAVNGLMLPKKLTWYTSENNSPKEERSSMEFQNIEISSEIPDSNLFLMPNEAVVVER
ncbi:MAG: hypothetical protein KTR22_03355 [Flavobacteriaceae bacterium]|nr:hypothetical protein [Flavobacteriaceae bacterium]